MQTILMLMIALLCVVSAVGWALDFNGPSVLAFIGFAVGYIGLAWAFA